MAKKNEDTGLATVQVGEIMVPDFLMTEEKEGVDDLAKHQTTPRLAIVQGQSDPERKTQFGEGAVAIMPDGVKVAAKEEEFVAIPLVFWPTWEVWSDINDQQTPMVTETTTDEGSNIAQRCKSPDTREERYGDRGEFLRRYVECLNFIFRIETGEAKGQIAIITFNGGEHYTGAKLCGMLKRRTFSIYANRIAFKASLRTRNNRSWYGLDFNNPSDGNATVQSKEEYEALKKMHRDLADMVGASKITVSRDDVPTSAAAPVDI